MTCPLSKGASGNADASDVSKTMEIIDALEANACPSSRATDTAATTTDDLEASEELSAIANTVRIICSGETTNASPLTEDEEAEGEEDEEEGEEDEEAAEVAETTNDNF